MAAAAAAVIPPPINLAKTAGLVEAVEPKTQGLQHLLEVRGLQVKEATAGTGIPERPEAMTRLAAAAAVLAQ